MEVEFQNVPSASQKLLLRYSSGWCFVPSELLNTTLNVWFER